MLIIRGVNVFPREIETVILEEPALGGAFAIVVDRRGTLAQLAVHAELAGDAPDGLADALRERLISRLRISAELHLHPFGTLARQEVGKAKRVYERTGADDPLGL